jgi:hypothetical protein
VRDAGFGATDLIVYARAESALERSLQRAESERVPRRTRATCRFSRRSCANRIANSQAHRGMLISARERGSTALLSPGVGLHSPPRSVIELERPFRSCSGDMAASAVADAICLFRCTEHRAHVLHSVGYEQGHMSHSYQ